MIPKVIHYCWFGGNPLPDDARRCIQSWKKFLPNYEIKEWNENNFDVNMIPYTEEAYKSKKYAFVSDFARLYVLNKFGGIYFDTDVEVLKPLESILIKGGYMGCEENLPKDPLINPGLGMAVEANNRIIQELLEIYKHEHFIKDNGIINTDTIVAKTTRVLIKNGYCNTGEPQCIEGIIIYPKIYFCPDEIARKTKSYDLKTYTAHHYTASWRDEKANKRMKSPYWHYFSSITHFITGVIKKTIGLKRWQCFRDRYLKKLYDFLRGI